MMRKYIWILTFLFTTTLFAQKVGEVVLLTGEKIDLYHKTFKNGKIRKASFHGQTINYFTKEAKRLHRIVAENEKYLLTDYYSQGRFQFYIFDKSTMKAVEKLKFQTYKPKKDIKLIDLLGEYFGDCTELISKIQSNFDVFYADKNFRKKMYNKEPRSILFENISNFKCE